MANTFSHVHLKSPDPGKTAQWYVKAFGFRILSDVVRVDSGDPNTSFGDRMIRCETVDGTGVIISGRCVTGSRAGERLGRGNASVHWGLEHFGFNSGNLDADIQRLEGLGADLLEGPIGYPKTKTRVAFLKGPDNVRFELVERA